MATDIIARAMASSGGSGGGVTEERVNEIITQREQESEVRNTQSSIFRTTSDIVITSKGALTKSMVFKINETSPLPSDIAYAKLYLGDDYINDANFSISNNQGIYTLRFIYTIPWIGDFLPSGATIDSERTETLYYSDMIGLEQVFYAVKVVVATVGDKEYIKSITFPEGCIAIHVNHFSKVEQ